MLATYLGAGTSSLFLKEDNLGLGSPSLGARGTEGWSGRKCGRGSPLPFNTVKPM